ncbi:MAG: hypothetical protein Q4G14_14940 [Paracoccus sp. (in: a-proteobacteria)]|uniref:hypothetical protein n=1 Tax=Paracoccus sp. TaxID=267 RepID=UPI0026DFA77B|nr:hypothetical protein [Paracoccus sp. (in: a-proteobacteria)]MDO5614522.1 hypothetical protein [Paracoccus sp. (in: a-proteobacteria)]
MTIHFSAAEFFDLLPIADITFHCPATTSQSRTEAGEVIRVNRGARLWRGDITLGKMTREEAAFCVTRLDQLTQAGASFMIWDRRAEFPLDDPDGVIAGRETLLHTINASGTIRLGGLPARYQLQVGDYLGFAYAENPVRHALHRVVAPTQASVNGFTPSFAIDPPLRPGAVTGTPVQLARAACKAVIVPGSLTHAPGRATITEGSSFSFIQTLR